MSWPVGMTPLVGAVGAAGAVLGVAQILPGTDMAATTSVVLVVLALALPLIRPDRHGVLVGLAATAVAVGYGLAAGDPKSSAALAGTLVLWLPAASVTLAVLDHDRRSRIPVFGERSVSSPPKGRRRAVLSGMATALVLAVVVLFVVRSTDDGSTSSTGRNRDRYLDKVRTGDRATETGPYLYGDELDTSRRFELSDEVVLRIEASAPAFWRGTTFDQWDGKTWTRRARVNVDNEVDPDPLETSTEELLFIQTVTVMGEGSDLLFGAYRPLQFIANPTVTAIEDDGTARTERPLGRGASYIVVSTRPQTTAAALVAAGPVPDELPDDFAQRYLQLPAIADRVVDLAAALTADQPTIYGKVRALEQWLGANTRYSLDIPELPPGADSVEQFLFEDRIGFCEQIASSLAVMLRSQGVPARVAVGYAGGTKRRFSDEYDVAGSDAHAWVEVWFPGLGWEAFDPTANVALAGEPVPERSSVLALVGAVAFAVVTLASFVAWFWHRRRIRAKRSWPTRILAELEVVGGRFGRPRQPTETVTEYLAVLGGGPLAEVDLTALKEGLVPAGYDRSDVGRPAQLRAEAALAAAAEIAPSRWRTWRQHAR